MTIARQDSQFTAYVIDLMQSIGPVHAKSMFGGHGIFLDGLMFALIADRILYLKVDEQVEADFIAEGLPPFSYHKKGKHVKMCYYQAPAETLEDIDVMNSWANRAYSAALRSAGKTKQGKSRTRP